MTRTRPAGAQRHTPFPSMRAGQGPHRRERRTFRIAPSDVRVTGKDKKTGLPTEYTAVVLRYNVLDDYWTKFRPGVFTESLEARMPRSVWSHDWSDPIGMYDDVVSDTEEGGLELHAKFANFEHVPSATKAASLMNDGIVDQFSVGFFRDSDEEDKDEPVVWITKGELIEASPVLAASVPGTSLVGMRTTASGLLVPLEEVERIVVSLGAGTLEITDALVAARDAAEDPTDDTPDEVETPVETPPAETPSETPPAETPPAPTPDPASPSREPTDTDPGTPDTDPAADETDEPVEGLDEALSELDDVLASLG